MTFRPECGIIIPEKREEIKKMKNSPEYVNLTTGEVTFSHTTAMEWYRGGDEISLQSYSEVLGEKIERLRWVH